MDVAIGVGPVLDVTVLLDDTRGCPGARSRVSGRTHGLCFSCTRLAKPGEQIKPAATRRDGVVVCDERRSEGHVADSEAPRGYGVSLGLHVQRHLGGCP